LVCNEWELSVGVYLLVAVTIWSSHYEDEGCLGQQLAWTLSNPSPPQWQTVYWYCKYSDVKLPFSVHIIMIYKYAVSINNGDLDK